MEIQLQDLVVLGIAIWVMFQLPGWAGKFIPANVGKNPLPTALGFILRIIIAFVFANIGWRGLANSLNNGYDVVREVAGTEQILRVINIPEVISALVTIYLSLWIIKMVFLYLKDPKDLTNAAIAAALVLGIFLFNNLVWDLLREYIVTNLSGAQLVIDTEPFQVVFDFFKKGGGQ